MTLLQLPITESDGPVALSRNALSLCCQGGVVTHPPFRKIISDFGYWLKIDFDQNWGYSMKFSTRAFAFSGVLIFAQKPQRWAPSSPDISFFL